MRVLITGGCGFLGQRLAQQLLKEESFSFNGAPPERIDNLVLTDRIPPGGDLAADLRVRVIQGDLLELLQESQLMIAGTDVIFHLSSAVSAECEADLDLGLRNNLDATRALLDACRAAGHRPLLVFSSSVAVFGDSPHMRLPAVIKDDTLPTPQNSYGIQKFICEQLVADYARKGFIQGRSVRLMTVSVRPGRPNGAASGFLSGLVREPLALQRTSCPVSPDTAVALSSPQTAIDGLIRAATTDAAQWGSPVAVNLPALTTTIQEMVDALERLAGQAAIDLIDWQPDAAIARIVSSWPSRIEATRAEHLGLTVDTSFDDILAAYVRENAAAINIKLTHSRRQVPSG